MAKDSILQVTGRELASGPKGNSGCATAKEKADALLLRHIVVLFVCLFLQEIHDDARLFRERNEFY